MLKILLDILAYLGLGIMGSIILFLIVYLWYVFIPFIILMGIYLYLRWAIARIMNKLSNRKHSRKENKEKRTK